MAMLAGGLRGGCWQAKTARPTITSYLTYLPDSTKSSPNAARGV
jgi:hypothetical protein